MSKKRIAHLVYDIIMSLLILAVAICFIVCSILIYNSGLHPYTSERISQYFGYIAPLVFITIAFIIGGIVLKLALPLEKKKLKGKIEKRQSLNAIYSRFDIDSFEKEAKERITRQKYLRITLYTIDLTLLFVTSILALVYLLNVNNYPVYTESGTVAFTENAIKGTLVMLRYLILPLLFTIATVIACGVSLNKELEIAKSQVKTAKKLNPVDKNDNESKSFVKKLKDFFVKNDKIVTLVVRIVLITVILTLLISGIVKGGVDELINKATAICKECVGMG
ncbi:MAG: hypothetical protein IJW54_01715 [Clostridia bacterium]|nr:hypothetical protein [Clostridia bacterium]